VFAVFTGGFVLPALTPATPGQHGLHLAPGVLSQTQMKQVSNTPKRGLLLLRQLPCSRRPRSSRRP
jgi:hypothetical protein